jgi:hypothetical protein
LTPRGRCSMLGVEPDQGVIDSGSWDVVFITAAKNGRVWDREPKVRPAF